MIPPLTEMLIITVTKALDCKARLLSPEAAIVIPAQGKYTGTIGCLGNLPGEKVFMGNKHRRKRRVKV